MRNVKQFTGSDMADRGNHNGRVFRILFNLLPHPDLPANESPPYTAAGVRGFCGSFLRGVDG